MAITYNSNYDETIPFSDVCEQFNLTANNAQSFTVPGSATNQYQAYFGYGSSISNVFVCLNSSPVIPSANTKGSQQYNELRPEKRYVSGGDVIYFITPDATAYASVCLRSLRV